MLFCQFPAAEFATGSVAAGCILMHVARVTENGKPDESRGHKATGLRALAYDSGVAGKDCHCSAVGVIFLFGESSGDRPIIGNTFAERHIHGKWYIYHRSL
jgi:hypothetical protein